MPDEVPIGAVCSIHGLMGKKELNGQGGTIIGFDQKTNRVMVLLCLGGKSVKIKREHLLINNDVDLAKLDLDDILASNSVGDNDDMAYGAVNSLQLHDARPNRNNSLSASSGSRSLDHVITPSC